MTRGRKVQESRRELIKARNAKGADDTMSRKPLEAAVTARTGKDQPVRIADLVRQYVVQESVQRQLADQGLDPFEVFDDVEPDEAVDPLDMMPGDTSQVMADEVYSADGPSPGLLGESGPPPAEPPNAFEAAIMAAVTRALDARAEPSGSGEPGGGESA